MFSVALMIAGTAGTAATGSPASLMQMSKWNIWTDYRGDIGTEGRVVFLIGILVFLCDGVGVDQVKDAPHLLCRGLIVCLLLHLHSHVTRGWGGVGIEFVN